MLIMQAPRRGHAKNKRSAFKKMWELFRKTGKGHFSFRIDVQGKRVVRHGLFTKNEIHGGQEAGNG